jgi:hypothetical protein
MGEPEPLYPSQTLARLTMPITKEDHRLMERLDGFLQTEFKLSRRVPHTALVRTALRATLLNEGTKRAFLEALREDPRFSRLLTSLESMLRAPAATPPKKAPLKLKPAASPGRPKRSKS